MAAKKRGSKTVEPIRSRDKVEAIKAMLRDRPRDYLLFILGINLALRVGDLLSLRVGDVWVHEKGAPKEIVTVSESKTGKTKRVAVNESARAALEWYFGGVGERPADEPLFKSMRSDKPLDKVQVWRMVNRWCAAVGVQENVGTHTMRKTWGYHARMAGVSIEQIQAKFGHSSPSITRAYIGISADEVAAVESLVSL
jgi:integrase